MLPKTVLEPLVYFKQKNLKAGGYNHIANLLTAIEQSGMYATELRQLEQEVAEKREFYKQLIPEILHRFPQYDTVYNAAESHVALRTCRLKIPGGVTIL